MYQTKEALKRPWCWEGLGPGGEGDDRGWDGWMASPTRWTWVWVNSGSWWWTGRPGVLRFMGSQRVGHDWATELNWTRRHSVGGETEELLGGVGLGGGTRARLIDRRKHQAEEGHSAWTQAWMQGQSWGSGRRWGCWDTGTCKRVNNRT